MAGTFNSNLDIVNRALQLLGARRIVSTDDKTENANEMSSVYNLIRDGFIRSTEWSCCIRPVTAAFVGTDNSLELKNEFKIPADCLKILKVNDYYTGYSGVEPQISPNELYSLQGTSIFTNLPAPLKLRYSYRNESVTTYDPLFIECLAIELAMATFDRIKGSSEISYDRLERRLAGKMREALHSNAIERPQIPPPDGNWSMARYGVF